jgi:hypothetical protein
LLDVVEIEVAASRGLNVDGYPDGSGIGQVTVPEIAEYLGRDRLFVDRERAVRLGDERCRRRRVSG